MATAWGGRSAVAPSATFRERVAWTIKRCQREDRRRRTAEHKKPICAKGAGRPLGRSGSPAGGAGKPEARRVELGVFHVETAVPRLRLDAVDALRFAERVRN